MTYRFLGTDSEVAGVHLIRFGQKVETEDHQAALKAICIPDADFTEIGFTESELQDYATPAAQVAAPASFHEKKRQALLILHKLRGE